MEEAAIHMVPSTSLGISFVVVSECATPSPLRMRLVLIKFKVESSKPMWLLGTRENDGAAAFSRAFLESQVESPEIRQKLTPKDAFGCKRILVLDNWLSMFNQTNVELITEKPVQITEHGIISEDGIEREVDVILNGTGNPPKG